MAQDAFAFCSQLLHRSIPASVAERGARFEAVDTEYIEGEVEDELRSFGKDACSPELGADRKAPVGDDELRTEGADVNETDRRISPDRHDGETDVLSGDPLPMRPRDVALESFHSWGRRRNESRYIFGAKQRKERRGVTGARLAEDDASSDEFGQLRSPVGSAFVRRTDRRSH